LPEIALNYLNTNFALDFLTNFPIFLIKMKRHREYIFYIIKMMRFKKGFVMLDVTKIMLYFKNRSKKKI
jgi:hypothetical protein